MLRNVNVHLRKDAHSRASSHSVLVNYCQVKPKQEDIVHQLFEDMEIGEQEPMPTNLVLEETTNHHIF